MKKDPLLPPFFDKRSGNSLVRYNAKLDKRSFLAECGPDAADSREWFWVWVWGLRPNSNSTGKSRNHCSQRSFMVAGQIRIFNLAVRPAEQKI
ncbi:hypothetical protein NE619_06720 [Anaerovorax odorimutans]|uniref:Uncharacterized protein n=1 Tax=Anaerovorax odorimutans TaxID=109327 RepID=A0ABT1RML8_9FIRM|nr:hypothetical protein [Anaerovorax odorimutans]